ncbi:MMPL family transporter [Mycobacterium uberis]|uniref:MMPL family transporter n=1 Tax=Mycobacterium uberis TaxID=2162698 RepID=UPI001FB3F831|nr:MMPL family transporter [Mycobacterium uberis]
MTGAAALTVDQSTAGEKGVQRVTRITRKMIIEMLSLFYRSIVQVILALVIIGIELMTARKIVIFLRLHQHD